MICEAKPIMNPIGIDYLTAFGLHPVEYIQTAAQVGADTVALPPASMTPLPAGNVPYSILEDAELRRNMAACLRDTGLRMGMIDGLAVWPGQDVDQYEKSLAGLAELGITIANTVSFDALDRSVDQFARLVEMAQPFGITVVLECCPVLTVRTLAQARGIVESVDQPNFKLLIDTMHVSRTGEAGLVSELDPGLIGYVQLCDAPLAMPATDEAYMEEALYERMVPGEGELPLLDIMGCIPPGVIVSAEVPLRTRRLAGQSHRQCAQAALDGVRRMIRRTQDASGIS